MASWLSSIGSIIYNAWTSVYYVFGTPSEPGSGGLEGMQAALGRNPDGSPLLSANRSGGGTKAITGKKGGGAFPATNLSADEFADILQYIPASHDVGAVCLAAGQTNSQIRDRITPFIFKEHHTATRFHRASPEQGQYLLTSFLSKSRNTAVVDALVLREVRTEPGKALKLVAAHRPLQLKTIDFFKTDLTWETDSIVDALVQCTNLTSITLSDCNITSRVLQDIAPTILQQLPNLKRLDLSSNKFRVDGAVALASMECFISAYDNSGNNNSKAFSLPNLEQLDLGGNSLGNKGIDALLRLGFPGKFTPNLQLLDLRNNALNDDGARTVMRYLAKNMRDNKESPIPKLNVLELSGNGVSSDMEKQLRELFFKVTVFVS